MADQHNDNIPALGNAIADDVVDIKENLEFHKDCFQAICDGWDNGSTANLKLDGSTITDLTATIAEINTVADGSTAKNSHTHLLATGATDVTSSAAELNIMDGVTATTSEINTLDGITSTVSELNILDGVTATTSEINRACDSTENGFFDTGTAVWFYQNTAPTGWTASGVADRVLAVKGGSQAYNANGGTQAGSWTQPNHTLTTNEIPAHTHTGTTDSDGAHTHDVTAYDGGAATDSVSWQTDGDVEKTVSAAAKSGGAHTHTFTSASGGGSGGAHNHGTTYRPYAALGIIATKDA